jgi:hypothetical protein
MMLVDDAIMAPFADMGEQCISNLSSLSKKQDRPHAIADTIIVASIVAKPTRTLPPRACRAERSGISINTHQLRKVATRRAGCRQDTDLKMGEIRGHRLSQEDPTLIEVLVTWEKRGSSWVPEGRVQCLDQDSLFRYWSTVKGGRFSILDESDLWHVLRIEDYRISRTTGKVELQITWIGSDERSWELEDDVAVHAEEHVVDYWGGLGGRDSGVAAIKSDGRKRTAIAVSERPHAKRAQK